MKRLAVTVLVALMLASCQEAPKGYVINGEVTGRTEGKVYLKSFRNKMFFDVDTAELKEGKFTFKGEVDQPWSGNRRYELSGSVLCRKYEYGCEDK